MMRPLLLGFLVTIGACASAPPATAPTPAASLASAIHLRDDWRSTVIVERVDSIMLALPSGGHQLQRFHRSAGFTLSIGSSGVASIRLDSLRIDPATADEPNSSVPIAAVWTGRVGDPAINAFRPSSGNPSAAQLTAVVRGLLPRLPVAGAQPKSGWCDSATGTTSSDMFAVTERRTATWSAGNVGGAAGSTTSVQLWEDFEQQGEGSNQGRTVTMTAQGRRTGTYYVGADGKILSVKLSDSSAISIGIPQTHELMSGVRYSWTTARFLPAGTP